MYSRMSCTDLFIYVLLVFSQFNEQLAQQNSFSVEERSPTNPHFYRIFNKHYALETDKDEDLVGADFRFYVSFQDNFFRNERYFKVEVFYMESNVFVFTVSLHTSGSFIVKVKPMNGPYTKIHHVDSDGTLITTQEAVKIRVLPPGRGWDNNCNHVGKFQLDLLTTYIFTVHKSVAWSDWITIERSNASCYFWKYGLPTWTFEMVLHDVILDLNTFYCLNPNKIRKVDISKYTKNIVNVGMSVPSREESFVIMPYTLPPSIFLLCNTEMIYNTPIKHCAQMRVTPVKDDCYRFMEPMRITMTPRTEEFMWPLEDLTITVHEYFCVFAALDKEYIGKVKYSYKWMCLGDVLCKRLLRKSQEKNATYTAGEVVELDTQDTSITIPKKYMTIGTTITIWFLLEYAHPIYSSFVCQGMENRSITFVEKLNSQLEWRCHFNCWYYVNPELPLLVGFECHECVITQANNPRIEWTVDGLNQVTTVGANTPYLEVTDFGSLTGAIYTKFFIRVKVSYTTMGGEREEVRLGRLFLLARNIHNRDILIRSNFLFETRVSRLNKNKGSARYFPQFSLDMTRMYRFVGSAAPIPVIATLSAVYDAADLIKVKKPETLGIDDHCVYVCRDVDQVPLEDGNYSHCTDCTKYVKCTNGYFSEWDCSEEMEAADEPICLTHSELCTMNMTNSTDVIRYIKDYIITRTLWAPQSFVLELIAAEDENSSATIQLELSSYAGLRKFQLLLDIFVVPRYLPAPQTIEDVEALWAVPHKTHEVVFIDASYLFVIARALEMTQVKRNPDYEPNKMVTQPSIHEGSLTNDNETWKNNTVTSAPGNYSADGGDNSSNSGILQAFLLADPILQSPESIKVLSLVESIIDALLSEPAYQMAYSNVDLFMASLVRMLNIYDYNIPIMEKANRYIQLVHDFHVKNLTEPASDDDMIRRKLEALCSLTNYFVRFRNKEPLLFQLDYPQVYEDALLETLYKIVNDISDRQGTRTPSLKSIVHKDFVVQGAWFDPLMSERFVHIHMGLTDFTIDVQGLLKSPAFDYVMYTFVNIAAYTSAASPLPLLEEGLAPNGPVMYLHIDMKHPLSLPLHVFAPGIYDIRYDTDFESVKDSTRMVNFDIYSKTSEPVSELTSDCYFVRVAASYTFGSTVTLKPLAKVTFGVRVRLSNTVKDGLKSIYEDEIILPQDLPENTKVCHGIAHNEYSIFLPPLSLRQQYELKGRAEYFILIRIIKDANYKSHDVSTSDLSVVQTEQVSVNCVRSTCLQLDQTTLISKYCRVSHCTGGIPPHVSCRCDRGYTFTANTSTCLSRSFDVNWKEELQIEDVQLENFHYLIPALIVGLWFIFLALFASARKSDKREKIMGKTMALQGVFSPFSRCQYLMCVVTGFGVRCGTKSIPYMTIVGSNRVSPRYKLQTNEYVFASGSEIWLVVSVPENLGKPKLIILSIETEGRKLSTWFVKEVYVRHVQSGNERLYVFNAWLPSRDGLMFAVDDGVPTEDVVKSTFGSVMLRLMRNQHPIFSIGYNIPGSTFTKTQHVVFCLCAVHILMSVCLMAHDLPLLNLVVDKRLEGTFSLKVDFFKRAIVCALISLVPIYVLGLLVETAVPIEVPTIDWRQEIKPPQERRQFKRSIFDPSTLPSREFIEQLLRNIDTVKSKKTLSTSQEPTRETSDTNIVDSKSVRSLKTPRQSQTVITPSLKSQSQSKDKLDANDNANVDDFETDEAPTAVSDFSFPIDSENKCVKCLNRVFPLPIYVCLALMWFIIAPVSYYTFMLGFYFTTAGSLEYVYVVSVAFIFLVAVLYPFWLTVVALVNTVLYLNGKWSYGTRSESQHRLKCIQAALPGAESMAHLNVVQTRTRSLGDRANRPLSAVSLMRSQMWCNVLILKKSSEKKNYVTYSNWETFLFIFVILLIINGQFGNVWKSYYQTEFISHSLHIRTVSDDSDKVLTYDGMWNHLLNIINTIVSWKSNSSTVSLSILSAVKISQIRAQPYKGNCEKDFPNIPFPTCNFDIEDSVVETRTFANRWNYPIAVNASRPGPYTYTFEGGSLLSYTTTSSHTYPDGGYTTLFTWWSKEPVMLNYLRKNNWVDRHTKAVTISMNFINVDSGLATVIQHIYEFKLTGIFMDTMDLYTFPLKLSQVEEFTLSCLVILLALMIAYFLINEIRACYHMGFSNYFSEIQSWLLLVERILSVAVLLVFLFLQLDRKSKLRQVHEAYLTEKDGTTFIDFNVVGVTRFVLLIVSSMLVVVCMIKVLFRFRDYEWLHNFVNMIPAVLKITYIPILVIIGFGLLGCLQFQSLLSDFRSISSSCIAVTILMLQSNLVVKIAEEYPVIGTLFVFALYGIMFYIVLNYFIVLLNEAYSECKRQDRLEENKGDEEE